MVWIPRAFAAGAEVRDLAKVGRIELGQRGRVTGVHYHREGEWRFQKARNVVVAGYAIETPRLLLNSACPGAPDGLANSSGLVGRDLMTQSNQGVYGRRAAEVRWNRAPPNLSLTAHWNYDDTTPFPGGYTLMIQGPMPQEIILSSQRDGRIDTFPQLTTAAVADCRRADHAHRGRLAPKACGIGRSRLGSSSH